MTRRVLTVAILTLCVLTTTGSSPAPAESLEDLVPADQVLMVQPESLAVEAEASAPVGERPSPDADTGEALAFNAGFVPELQHAGVRSGYCHITNCAASEGCYYELCENGATGECDQHGCLHPKCLECYQYCESLC